MFIYKNKGVTLLEIMLAMLMSSIIISALLSLFISIQQSFQVQVALRQIQKHAYSAINIIETEVHAAGYIGCAKLTDDFFVNSNLPYTLTSGNKLSGNSSEIIIRHASKPIKNFNKDSILLVSNCEKANIIYGRQLVAKDRSLEINKFQINKIYVSVTSRHYIDGSPVLSLYIEDIQHTKIEYVEGIEKIIFHYYFDQAGKIKEVSVSEIKNWLNLVAVSVDLELYSPPIRKVWHTFISLRDSHV